MADTDQEKKRAIKRAMDKLLARDRSEKELRDFLYREGFSEEAQEAAVAYVSSFGYLNDDRFAVNYAFSYRKKKSRAAMRFELQQKGITEAAIDEAFAQLPEDEDTVLSALLRKKAGEPHHLQEGEKRKIYAFLQRKGFPAGAVMHALHRYEEEADESFFGN